MTSIVISILGNASNFVSATGQAQSALDKWGARAGKVGAGIAASLGAAAAAAVKSAADQSSAVSAWTQVTGKQMDAQQKTIARSLNLSQTEYAKSFTTLSSLYQSNGIARDQANKMAAKGLKLAADQAAFGNTTVAEAVEAQAGLLKGSGELLEKYAISITAADVAARLKATGADKLKGAELKAATAAAKMALVQEQSAKFTGQAAREANSLESRQQKLTATIEDYKAKLGAQLLPIVEKFVGKLQSVAEWVSKNETKTKVIVGVLAGFAAVLLTVSAAIKVVRAVQAAWNAIMIATNVIMFANPIVFVIAGLVALGAALVVAYKKSETFRNIVNGVWEAVKKAFGAMWDFMRFNAAKGVQFVFGIYAKFADSVLGVWEMLLRGAAKLPRWLGGGKFDSAADAVAKIRDGIAKMKAAVDSLPTEHELNFKANTGSAMAEIANLRRAAAAAGVSTSGTASSSGGGTQQGRFGGMRAGGGPVTKGKTYLVGEKGPELFTAAASGRIVPNAALRAKGSAPRLLETYGKLTVDGFAKGVKNREQLIDDAMSKVTDRISKAVEKMKAAVERSREIAKTIRESFASFGNITGIETGDRFMADLRARRDQAEAFAKGVTELRRKGLDRAALEDLTAAGPGQGLAAVEQLLNRGGISTVNADLARIRKAGEGLGIREASARTGIDPRVDGRAYVGKQTVELKLSGDGSELTEAIVNALRKKVRNSGGNVQVVLGTAR